MIGMNVAGAEFTSGTLPGVHDTHYFFPRAGYFDRWYERGIQTIRFPIKWERLQPALNGEFDPTYQKLIDDMLNDAAKSEMSIILDVHNYGRFRGNAIGSAEVPFSAYANLMERMAARWKSHPALYAYDIMNEPHGSADQYWAQAAQAGINAIRKQDRVKPIIVEGMSYSSAFRWPRESDSLKNLHDPSDNLIFSAHIYLDSDASGRYQDSADAVVDPMVGVRRAEPFINWLKLNNKRGQIGEMGIPNEPRYLAAMDNLLSYLQSHCVPVMYWAAGRAWGNYRLSLEPNSDGTNKPHWYGVEPYVGQGDCHAYGPF